MAMENFNREIYTKNLEVLEILNPGLVKELENTEISNSLEILTSSNNLPVLKYQGLLCDQPEQPLTAATTWAKRIFNPNHEYIITGFCTGYHVLALSDLGAKVSAVIEPNLEILKAALSLQDFTKVLARTIILTNQKDFRFWLTNNFGSSQKMEFLIFPQALNNLSRPKLMAYKRSFALAKGQKYIIPNILAFLPPRTDPSEIKKDEATIVELDKPIKSLTSLKIVKSDFIDNLSPEQFEKLADSSEPLTEEAKAEIFSTCIVAYTLNLIKEEKAQIVLSMYEPLFSCTALKALRNAKSIYVTWLTKESYPEYQLKTLEFYDYVFVCCPKLLEQLEDRGIYQAIYLPLFSSEDNSSNLGEVLGYIYSDHFNALLQLFDSNAWKTINRELTADHELRALYQQVEKKALSPNLETLTAQALQYPELISSPDVMPKFMFLYYLMEVGKHSAQ
jgi:hypothetical protein